MTENLEARREYEARINRALDFINEKMDEEINLTNLSRAACFSLYHFHRIFTGLIGETPNDYLRRLRLEKAANMLERFPARSVTEIALECGFSSSSVFARSFKEHFGVSAKDYRKHGHKLPAGFKNLLNDETRTSVSKKIEMKKFPAFHLAYVRCLEGYNHNIGKAWSQLFRWAYPRNLVGPETVMIGIPLDNPDITPAGKCRYYCCITLPENFREQDLKPGVSVMDIPAGSYAVYHFEGFEKGISRAYQEFYGVWLPDSGFVPSDNPAIELYAGNEEMPKGKFRYDICLQVSPL